MALFAMCVQPASALTLFSDNFNTNTSASWTINKAPNAVDPKQTAQFAFDYSGFGIPAPPGSSGTLGLRLRANLPLDGGGNEVTTRPAGALGGLSLSPTGKDFGTTYYMAFDAWGNFFGAPNANGLADNAASEGGTYNILSVVGTSGTVPLVVGNGGTIPLAANGAMDGIGLATTPDGGIANDFRIYAAADGSIVAGTNPAYKALSNANTATLYTTTFPAKTAPAIQQTLSTAEYGADAANTQLGSTQAGSFGFAWHHVVIAKIDNQVTWTVDGTLLVDADISGIPLGGNNIALGVSDVNTSTARHPSLAFTIFDNLVVTDTAPVTPVGQLGDFNNDSKVDADDYVTWRKNEVANGSLPNDNGATSQADRYTLWRANFGKPPGAGAGLEGASVPEPSSLLLLLSAGCLSLCRRKA
jgi:hypothetical protein